MIAVEAGDICGIVGPKDTATGDTLCAIRKRQIVLEQIRFPETVISMAIEPESSGDRKKLVQVLDKLQRQDPTFTANTDAETGQDHRQWDGGIASGSRSFIEWNVTST